MMRFQSNSQSSNPPIIVIILFVCFVGVLIWLFANQKEHSAADIGAHSEYFTGFNESFIGVVKKVQENPVQSSGTKSALLTVDLIKATSDYYDPRDSLEYFYCIIYGKKAQVKETTKKHLGWHHQWRVNDTIWFDGKRDTTYKKIDGRYYKLWQPIITGNANSNFNLERLWQKMDSEEASKL